MKRAITKKTTLPCLFAAVVMFFSSCVKDSVSIDPDAKKLTRIEYEDGSYESVEYNADGTLKKITNHSAHVGGADHSEYSVLYTNALVTELNGSDGSRFKYTYEGKKVVKTEIFLPGGNLLGYYQYSYVDDKVSRVESFIRVPGTNIPTTPTMRYENEYYINGNLKKITFYSPVQGGNMKKTSEVGFGEYDGKFNTYGLFENNPFLPLANFVQNNPLRQTIYDANGGVSESISISYTYDDAGNPLTRKTVTKPTGQAEYTENVAFKY